MENFFKKLGLDVIVPFILILLLFMFFVIYNQAYKKILVVHSYYVDYTWVNEINAGLEKVFKNSSSVKVAYFYMDTKRRYKEHLKEQAGLAARQTINQLQPDVVIICDDDAQSYVTTYYKNHPTISFVFAGVNANIEEYDFDKMNNVTGILERLPMDGIKDAILGMAEHSKIQSPIRIGHVGTTALTIKLDDAYLHQYKNWDRIVMKPSRLVDTFPEWKKAILDANNDWDFIMISNYRNVIYSQDNQTLVPPKEIMKWTVENAKIPIIGLNNFVVEDGAPFAVSTSAVEQGEEAAKMALRIIQEKIPANQIPIQSPKYFIVSMRPKLMEKFSMVLPEIYTAFARVSQMYFE